MDTTIYWHNGPPLFLAGIINSYKDDNFLYLTGEGGQQVVAAWTNIRYVLNTPSYRERNSIGFVHNSVRDSESDLEEAEI